jgi:hypothetical protein
MRRRPVKPKIRCESSVLATTPRLAGALPFNRMTYTENARPSEGAGNRAGRVGETQPAFFFGMLLGIPDGDRGLSPDRYRLQAAADIDAPQRTDICPVVLLPRGGVKVWRAIGTACANLLGAS